MKNLTGNEFIPKYKTSIAGESRNNSDTITQIGIVREVIYKNQFVNENDEQTQIAYAGCIKFQPYDVQYDDTRLLLAYPMDVSIINLPIEGERIEVFTKSRKRYYRKITNGTNLNNSIEEKQRGDILKSENIQFLQLYTGDSVFQSRFGQSIRLGAYNNPKNKPSPAIIIRNKISSEQNKKDISENVIEDINKDGGTILISSDEFVSNFIPGVLDKNNETDFKLKVWEKNEKKYAFENYPKKLDGNQIIITSDRLILSSRINEMMFFSKGMLSFVSDTGITIDSSKGISIVNQKGEIQFENNNRETLFFVGESGKIYLGIQKGQKSFPAVNGTELGKWLSKLINEIILIGVEGGYLTGGGPTSATNPATIAKFNSLAQEFEKNVLSKKVYIGM